MLVVTKNYECFEYLNTIGVSVELILDTKCIYGFNYDSIKVVAACDSQVINLVNCVESKCGVTLVQPLYYNGVYLKKVLFNCGKKELSCSVCDDNLFWLVPLNYAFE